MKPKPPRWLPEMKEEIHEHRISRRRFFGRAAASTAGLSIAAGLGSIDAVSQQVQSDLASRAIIPSRAPLRISNLETFILRNSWVFVKLTTDEGIVGWGEMLKDKSHACAAEAHALSSYLIGLDPRNITHIWQAIYRHGFYRSGPVLTSVLSGIDQALWDIKAKALGVPVYELLGGPTRERIRIYGNQNEARQGICHAFKTQLRADDRAPYRYVEGPAYVREVVESFARMREEMPAVDIGVEFHGASQPQTSLLLMKALEPYQPFFYEEIVQAQNLDVMAEMASKTHIPVATGERVYTKWEFREVLEKKAATILQPDVCYAGGITELKLIAGMAEAFYVPLAPHNPQGPCSLAASCQIAAAIPNFLIQERGTDTHENLLVTPFQQVDGFLPLPTAPEMGIEIDEEKLRAQVGEPEPYRRTYDRDDGSVVDW